MFGDCFILFVSNTAINLLRNKKIPEDKATINMFLKLISCDFILYIKMHAHVEIFQRAETLSFFFFRSLVITYCNLSSAASAVW